MPRATRAGSRRATAPTCSAREAAAVLHDRERRAEDARAELVVRRRAQEGVAVAEVVQHVAEVRDALCGLEATAFHVTGERVRGAVARRERLLGRVGGDAA